MNLYNLNIGDMIIIEQLSNSDAYVRKNVHSYIIGHVLKCVGVIDSATHRYRFVFADKKYDDLIRQLVKFSDVYMTLEYTIFLLI